MANEFTVGDRLTRVLRRVRGLADGPVGTGHLLFSLTHDQEAGPLLDAFEITSPVAYALVMTPGRVAAGPDAGPFDDHARVRGSDDRVIPISAAAAAALRDGAQDSPMALLAAILGDAGSDASAVIRECGVDPDEVRQAVVAGRAPQRPDRLAPELRPARDALIGRVRYRGRGLRDRLLFSVLARVANLAARPVLWARLEADERAREQRRATRTDDILLALLVTHEVAAAYPHMIGSAKDNYGGGEALLAQGVDHRRVRAATLDDRPDEVSPATILRPGPDWTDDTQVLLNRLVAHPGNRAARLLADLGRGIG
jgi:hypothetical protein